jgi:hypothetical protein
MRKPLDMARVVRLIRSHGQHLPSTWPGYPADRRTSDRRKISVAGFVPERRATDRRAIRGRPES